MYEGYGAGDSPYRENVNGEPGNWRARLRWWLDNKLNNIFEAALSIIIPFIQICVFLGLIVIISMVINVYLRRIWVPKALIHERVYFNYVDHHPTARVKLNYAIKQWDYVREGGLELDNGGRFLKVGNGYDVHTTFTIAKSARNYDIGATPVTLELLDGAGQTIAKSVRALVIPYQHPMSLLLEAVAFFPWRALQYMSTAETVDVWVDLMRDYREPAAMLPGTESLALTLSAPVMDVSHAYVTVMPQLRGIVYYMYYHPVLSFVVGTALVALVQIVVYGGIAVVMLVARYAYQATSSGPADPLQAYYAQSRRRRATDYATAAPTGVGASGGSGGGVGGSASMGAPIAPVEMRGAVQQQNETVQRQREVQAGRREFVSTHIAGGVAASEGEEDIEEEVFSTGVIDTINAELLERRDANRGALVGRPRSSISAPLTPTRSPPSGSRRGADRGMRTEPSPEDKDISTAMYKDARRTAEHARTPFGGAGRSPAGRHTAAAVGAGHASPDAGFGSPYSSAANTPYSQASHGREASDVETSSGGGDDLERVFENDFFNSFLPYLRRKGSTEQAVGTAGGSGGGRDKKTR